MLRTTVTADGERNFTLQITGRVAGGYAGEVIYRVDPIPPRLKLAAATWLVQEKMTILLLWDNDLAFPMESRNSIRFEHGLKPTKDWNGKLRIEALNNDLEKSFFFTLDFDK